MYASNGIVPKRMKAPNVTRPFLRGESSRIHFVLKEFSKSFKKINFQDNINIHSKYF